MEVKNSRGNFWYLKDLADFCAKNQLYTFEANQDERPIVVSIPAQYSAKILDTPSDDRFLSIHLKACHTGTNLNHSEIPYAVMTKNAWTIQNCPILADVCKTVDDDGQETYDFAGHTMHPIEDPETGEQRMEYIERSVGTIPANAKYELRKEANNTRSYLHVDGLIYEIHGNLTASILRKRKEVACSVEIAVVKMHYDVKRNVLVIDDFKFVGVTLLGKDVKPGMEGATATAQGTTTSEDIEFSTLSQVADTTSERMQRYSSDTTSIDMRQLLQRIENLEVSLQYKNSGKGGNTMTHLQELLEKYSVTEADLTFEYQSMTDEQLDEAFSAAFESDDAGDGDGDGDGGNTDGNTDEGADPASTSATNPDEPTSEPEPEPEPSTDEKPLQSDGEQEKPRTLTNAAEFALAVDDLYRAFENADLSSIVGTNDYYICDLYLDPQQVVVRAFTGNKVQNSTYYRMDYQLYRGETDIEAECSNPVAVNSRWVTPEEDALLSAMQSNYAALEAEANEYRRMKLNSKLDEILSSAEYDLIRETEAFSAINIETFESEDALRAELDTQLLNVAKSNPAVFTAQPQPQAQKKQPSFLRIFSGTPQMNDASASFLANLEKKALK